MKKSILLALSASVLVFFIACSNNEPSEKIVQKYEVFLNTSVKQEIQTSLGDDTDKVDITFSPFVCKADSGFILCNSQNLSLRDKESNKEMLSIAKLEIRANDYYSGDATGLISFKDYVDDVLKKNKKAESTFSMKGIKLGEAVKADMQNGIRSIGDTNIEQFLNKLTEDEYNFEFYNTYEKEADELKSQGYFSFNNARNTLNYKLSVNPIRFNSNFYQALDSVDLKFNTDTYDVNRDALNKLLESQNDYNTPNKLKDFGLNFAKGMKLSGFNMDFSIDTENLFEGYVNMAKGLLQTNDNPQISSLTQKALVALNDITKNPVYKINLAVKLKDDVIVADYDKIGLDSVENITLNGQDFTKEFKEQIVPYLGHLMVMAIGMGAY